MNNPKAFQHDGFETTSDGQEFHTTYQGMTLLDYFAGQALAGMEWTIGYSNEDLDLRSLRAYDQAMSMLFERERRMKGETDE